jgi:PhzF family phenazine biosynthesis protein
MRVPIFQIDAFTSRLFAGNPAAVCPLETWPEEGILQAMAAENNLSETAYFVRRGERFDLRWFTPTVEVDLCGHATLASAFVILNCLDAAPDAAVFDTRSGELIVRREGDLLSMDFPARPPEACQMPPLLAEALGRRPAATLASRDLMALFETEEEVRALRPNMDLLAQVDTFAVIATAPGREADFVSRFFAPRGGVPEDPVTGSAHCTLVPYWSQRLGQSSLYARQVSARGGELWCEDRGARVTLKGRAVLYLKGEIII